MITPMPAVGMSAIFSGPNMTLAHALFTSQEALRNAFDVEISNLNMRNDALKFRDEVGNFCPAATLFATFYPGRRDLLDADGKSADSVSRSIFDDVLRMRTSLLRDCPEQNGAGFLTIHTVVEELLAIPQEQFDATLEVARRFFASAAMLRESTDTPSSRPFPLVDDGPDPEDQRGVRVLETYSPELFATEHSVEGGSD